MKFASDKSDSEEEVFDINVIPLIDVLLVLLIFFMASSSFVAAGGLDVKLPSAQSASVPADAPSVRVTIDKAGGLSIDGKSTQLDTLSRLFAEYSMRNPKPLVVVRADEQSEHGSLVKVLDLAKVHGLNDVAIAAMVGAR